MNILSLFRRIGAPAMAVVTQTGDCGAVSPTPEQITAARIKLARLVAENRQSAEIESYRAHRRAALKARTRPSRALQG